MHGVLNCPHSERSRQVDAEEGRPAQRWPRNEVRNESILQMRSRHGPKYPTP